MAVEEEGLDHSLGGLNKVCSLWCIPFKLVNVYSAIPKPYGNSILPPSDRPNPIATATPIVLLNNKTTFNIINFQLVTISISNRYVFAIRTEGDLEWVVKPSNSPNLPWIFWVTQVVEVEIILSWNRQVVITNSGIWTFVVVYLLNYLSVLVDFKNGFFQLMG